MEEKITGPITTLTSEKLSNAAKDFDRLGYAVIPKVFTKPEVDLIRKSAYEEIRFIGGGDPCLQKKGDKPALLFWPKNFYLHCISRDDRMVQLARYFLGDDIIRLNNQVYFRESGDVDEFAWHQDICFRTPPETFDQIETGYLQTIIVVDEISDNGAIEFVPGTHRMGDLNLIPRDNYERNLRRFVRGGWYGDRLIAQPGDMMIWSVMSVHGSQRNDSGRNRMTYMNGFAKASCVKTNEFPMYLKNGRLI